MKNTERGELTVKKIDKLAGWVGSFWLFLAAGLLASGCGQNEQVMELGMQTLEQDTTWQGTVIVSGDLYVPPGVTLTVLPGTTVKFKRIDEKSAQNMFGLDSPYYPEAELIIRGKIIARGTKKENIVFTSAEIDARPKDWGAINLLGSEGNVIEYCKVLFAYNAIHGHGAAASISHNEFAKNGTGISFKMEEETPDAPWFGKISDMEITHNLIHNNGGGIGLRNSRGIISYNTIQDNKFFGIFPKESAEAVVSYNEVTGNKKGIYLYQTRNLRLENNNIYDNSDYNISVAEAQDFDIDARNNWFGTTNPAKIEALIFDKKDDQDLGEVLVEPFLPERLKW